MTLPDGRVVEVIRKRVAPLHVLLTYGDITEARRARNEAHEALERQTATAEVLKVISSSPTDVQPVSMSSPSTRRVLLARLSGGVFRFDGELIHVASSSGINSRRWPSPAARFR
jgi:pyruvate/2-oxoglutarate/acetoin dehydrogenase E1 component